MVQNINRVLNSLIIADEKSRNKERREKYNSCICEGGLTHRQGHKSQKKGKTEKKKRRKIAKKLGNRH